MTNIRTPAPEKKASFLDTPEASQDTSKAPDYKPKGVMKGTKRQISLTIPPALLAEIDVLADEEGLSRASWISQTLRRAIKHG
ncbi:ribbon-helix-helix domain-containing protein [Nitrosospira sp. Nsp13]|uniref:ribbon-helix-helix domain-containing protein n=1 Tax=Nitrosospira sp. Nsp13 TaxID=1855332 RepID=UPI00088B763E|nr:ribbon-helix-helix domain-containing protein [Nitrosospira sp. Nsp13]SCY13952.1 hypothetical protein SAMN05216308_104229 [Nitrosospira sp. Nsp13]